MPHTAHTNIALQDGEHTVRFRYECWSNHQGEGLMTVKGHTAEDHLYLINNRTAVADMLKQETGLKHIRYCEDQGNARHTEIKLTVNAEGRVTQALNTNAYLTTSELNKQGQELLDQEHKHHMNLTAHEFGKLSKSVKDGPKL